MPATPTSVAFSISQEARSGRQVGTSSSRWSAGSWAGAGSPSVDGGRGAVHPRHLPPARPPAAVDDPHLLPRGHPPRPEEVLVGLPLDAQLAGVEEGGLGEQGDHGGEW